MASENETVADIVAEMRKDIAELTVGIWSDFGGEIASGYADRSRLRSIIFVRPRK